MGGTPKIGIQKENWSSNNFLHPFFIGNNAIHFSAKKLHEIIYEKVKDNKRLTILNKNIDNPEELNSDYVLVCSGSPKEINEEYVSLEEVSVNSAYVVQCPWDHPRFNYSLTNAMQYGWVFGIPLENRISIGYLYNDEINNLEEIKEDIKKVFEQYSLTPSDQTNHLSFKSHYKKNTFGSKVCYSGNAAFFIEPLEATSIHHSLLTFGEAFFVWTNKITVEEANLWNKKTISEVSSMIALHYLAGSKYNTEFWKYAQFKAREKIKKEFENETEWSKFVWSVIMDKEVSQVDIGTWGALNYRINIEGLGIKDKLIQIRNSTKSIAK
jgi:hypothetical protein